MKLWLQDNIIQILLILAGITFGYANFTRNIEVNAENITKLESRIDRYEEKLDTAIKLLERIDERTSRN